MTSYPHLQWLRELPGRPLIVAEVKMRSPYGWVNPLELEEACAICEEMGDIISVHTDPLWGGSFDLLLDIRACIDKPILAKGFHPTVAHVREALGCLNPATDWVLTVGWHPEGDLGKRCWHEAESLLELEESDASRVVWNNRNPRTGQSRAAFQADARELRKGWLCQASHIKGPADVVAGMDAVLIGEGLYT